MRSINILVLDSISFLLLFYLRLNKDTCGVMLKPLLVILPIDFLTFAPRTNGSPGKEEIDNGKTNILN